MQPPSATETAIKKQLNVITSMQHTCTSIIRSPHDSHARMVNIYTHMKLLLATAALQWWQQADKHLNNCRASKEYHTPPLSKVDHLCNEHHNNFILVDWSKPVKSVHILLFDHHTTPAVPWTDPKLYQCHYHYYINITSSIIRSPCTLMRPVGI